MRDEENYHFYIEKLNKLNEQIGSIIDRENRNMNRIQQRKKAKRDSKKLEYDPLTGKPLVPVEKDGEDKEDRKGTQGSGIKVKHARVLSEAPQLSVIERTKMMNNFKMALETKK